MRSKKRLTDPSQVPLRMSKREEAEFWSSHEITKEFLDKTERAEANELPPVSKSISVRFDDDVLQRLRKLAAQKRKKYQTLLKEFVVERLYEEEKRQQRPYSVTDQYWHGVTAVSAVPSSAKPAEVAINGQSLPSVNPALLKGGANGTQDILSSRAFSNRIVFQRPCSFLFSNNVSPAVGPTQNLEDPNRLVVHGSD